MITDIVIPQLEISISGGRLGLWTGLLEYPFGCTATRSDIMSIDECTQLSCASDPERAQLAAPSPGPVKALQ